MLVGFGAIIVGLATIGVNGLLCFILFYAYSAKIWKNFIHNLKTRERNGKEEASRTGGA
jgi:hypothetical protein